MVLAIAAILLMIDGVVQLLYGALLLKLNDRRARRYPNLRFVLGVGMFLTGLRCVYQTFAVSDNAVRLPGDVLIPLALIGLGSLGLSYNSLRELINFVTEHPKENLHGRQ
jgi:hypothetical protein